MKLEIGKDKISQMFRMMLEIRLIEEKVFELYGQNLIPGMIHLYPARAHEIADIVCTVFLCNGIN